MSDLVGNPEDRFSHNEAHIVTSYPVYGVSIRLPFCIKKLNRRTGIKIKLQWKAFAYGRENYVG